MEDRQHAADGIAVVGMAGRFPGAPDVATFWRNLLDGMDAVHDYTDAELRALGVGERLLADPAHVRAGGRLPDVARFDAEFFGVPAAEAVRMDPQHRLFVEQSWAALEDAGCDPASHDGLIGVFAGGTVNRYFLFHQFGGNPDEPLDPGFAADYLTAQAAYRLGLTGPAVTVQTACSSSLVAICMAGQQLLDYRCDLALAGGVSVMEPRFVHRPGGLVSPDGRCRAFDAAGQGSGYSSGVAVLALKRLEDALADRDQIIAVLRGWAVNNDGGLRAGFAAPGLDGQASVVAEALAAADLTPASIGYVEAHGSGTAVGDAIEVAALAQVFAAEPLSPRSVALGSVKTNIGNLDAAAGAAGLIKAILAVRHGVIPANLHYDRPNPDIDVDSSPFYVPVKNVGWQAEVRRAGVSAFGMGGTNAHVIVEQAPAEAPRPEVGGWHVLPLSARTPEALRAARTLLAEHLATAQGTRLDNVAYTLATGRRAFSCRAAVLCRDIAEAVAELRRHDGDIPVAVGAPEELRHQAAAWVEGAGIGWPLPDGRTTSLPAYPFQRVHYWQEDRS
ncbi:beta-ketoacyl synthase N-terminal-like domain-containing protein [Nonomuraea sp. 3N208]|uniref:beta-ketoacyl synthase N-terminal-like domain-containing protein n=1 Tax=Nonomuraea sp. 3N208 TaxID=3457421 RepID=UPI003FD2711A